jgi:hypothetical protein
MPVLAFPGPDAPPPPPVTLEVPDGWDAVPPGADLLRARGTGGAGDPVEVAVRQHTAPAGYAATDLVDALDEHAERLGSEVEPPFVVEIGGREWTARNVSWDEPDGAVVEVHLATAVEDLDADSGESPPRDGTDDDDRPDVAFARLLLVTGRVRGASLDADYDLLQSVLESLVVGGAR